MSNIGRPATRLTRNSTLKPATNLGMNKGLSKENLSRPPVGNRSSFLKDTTNKVFGLKRKSESEADMNKPNKKRSAFGDITNAIEKNLRDVRKESFKSKDKLQSTKTLKNNVKLNGAVNKSKKVITNVRLSETAVLPKVAAKSIVKEQNKNHITSKSDYLSTSKIICEIEKNTEKIRLNCSDVGELIKDTDITLSQELKGDAEDSIAYITASEESPSVVHPKTVSKSLIPFGVADFDSECKDEPYAVANYAHEIFEYYKERESKFKINNYISKQLDVSRTMRSILVDWMVEVQESFELNHETLYLAVKIVDLYLSRAVIKRDSLQLIGSTAVFIACKFDERIPPFVDDFLYICDDAYKKQELILMEIKILTTLGYDLGVPLSYRFLRRYARSAKISMEDLTLARYILESSLLDYDLVSSSDYKLAAAALCLALSIRGIKWNKTLQYYSGCSISDIKFLVKHLHNTMSQPPKEHLKTIRSKYSHKVFFEVAKISVPENISLEME